MTLLQVRKNESRNVNPLVWMEGRLNDWKRVVFDADFRGAHLSALHSESMKKQKTIERTLQFWTRSVAIYSSYKACQLRVHFVKDDDERVRLWEEQHERAAEKVYALCYDLKGFFLKTAQLLAKPDLSPMAWVRRLVVLCDQAPQTSYASVQQVLEEELGRPLDDVFERFDVQPLASASVAQVHRARVKGASKDVAVKVQHPGAHELMMTDIRNQRAFGAFLQRFDLHLDLISIMDELEQQVEYEFDFIREAKAMDRIGQSLEKANRGKCPIIIPRSVPGLVTRRVLVMDFLEGTPILQLGAEMARRGINPDGMAAKLTKRNIIRDLSSAYGQMILRDGFFQADPHPGNILINKKGKVALLDYGQTKELSEELKINYARVVVGLANNSSHEVGEAFKTLGIETSGDTDPETTMTLAQLLFDTKLPHGWKKASVFGDDSILQVVKVEKLPKNLFFILRAAQLLRGLSMGMGVTFSSSQHWKPLALKAIEAAESDTRRRRDGSKRELVWERRRRLRREGRLQADA